MDVIGAEGDAEVAALGPGYARWLYALAALVAAAAVIGNGLVVLTYNEMFNPVSGPSTASLVGRFLSGVSVPLGLAGLIMTAGVFVSGRGTGAAQG